MCLANDCILVAVIIAWWKMELSQNKNDFDHVELFTKQTILTIYLVFCVDF